MIKRGHAEATGMSGIKMGMDNKNVADGAGAEGLGRC